MWHKPVLARSVQLLALGSTTTTRPNWSISRARTLRRRLASRCCAAGAPTRSRTCCKHSPLFLTASSAADQYLQYMDQVLPSGSDVVFGGKAAHLGQVGSPSGRTLAADPVIGELARCLGNVVAASIFTGAGITEEPTEVAAGVSQPASGTATAHAVVCVAWPSQATAAKYAANVRKALSTELSYEYDQPYSVMLPNATVTSIGGSQHVIQWQADTPGGADTVLQMATSIDLPALPDCNLPSAGKVLVIGCT